MGMTRSDLIQFHKEESNICREIMKRKNHDYTGDTADPFANFKACEDFGVCDTGVGFLVRMLDKMKRLKTFVHTGHLEVRNESFVDACRDLMNYSVLFHAWAKDKEGQFETLKSIYDQAEDEELKKEYRDLVLELFGEDVERDGNDDV